MVYTKDNDSLRERARQRNGEFGFHERSVPEMTLGGDPAPTPERRNLDYELFTSAFGTLSERASNSSPSGADEYEQSLPKPDEAAGTKDQNDKETAGFDRVALPDVAAAARKMPGLASKARRALFGR